MDDERYLTDDEKWQAVLDSLCDARGVTPKPPWTTKDDETILKGLCIGQQLTFDDIDAILAEEERNAEPTEDIRD
jgi:hypothetical protein